jgi:pimeloyl-ACP methyl ester carboxylesterase
MNIQEKQVVVDDLLTTYYDSGSSQKPILLFLHGWGSNSTLWFRAVEQLEQAGYRLVFLDLPGFGKTQTPVTAFTLDLYLKFVDAFTQKLGIQECVLIGHSFGGKLSAHIAAQKTHVALRGIVLVDASGLPHASIFTKLKARAAHMVKPLFAPPFMHDARTTLLRLFGSDDYVAEPKLRQTFINIIQEHVTLDLPRISVPTLIVWGSNDTNEYSPPEDATRYHKSISGSELCILEGASHYSFLDKPDEFQKRVLLFVRKSYGKI